MTCPPYVSGGDSYFFDDLPKNLDDSGKGNPIGERRCDLTHDRHGERLDVHVERA